MSPRDEALVLHEKTLGLAWEDLKEAIKEVPEEIRKALFAYRKSLHFTPEKAGKTVEKLSPSGKYKLIVTWFETTKGCWSFTQGEVFSLGSDTPIATVQRNFSSFPNLFVEGHPNGHDYFVCGEDYQGQTVIELDTGRRRELLPEEAKGHGFCWSAYKWIESMQALEVDGCYWAAPYEFRFYDFSDPMNGWPQIGADVCIDEDRREPELRPDGTIKVFQTEYTEPDEADDGDDDAPEPLGAIAAYKVFRREGLNLVEVESWISDKEKERRRRNEEYERKYEEWYTNLKTTDPLYLTAIQQMKDPAYNPAEYNTIGQTHDKWCPDFAKKERRMCRRIADRKGGVTIDLEWATDTGPIKLVIFRDGKHVEDKFFHEHSAAAMIEAFAYAKSALA